MAGGCSHDIIEHGAPLLRAVWIPIADFVTKSARLVPEALLEQLR